MKISQYLAANEQKILLFLLVTGFLGLTLHVINSQQADTADMSNAEIMTESKQLPYFDINTVTAQELMTISGIGNVRANSIIDYRDENHPITLEDVLNVKGVGEKTLENMRGYFYANND